MKYRILAAVAALATIAGMAVVPSTVGAGEPGSPTRLNTDLQAGGPDRQLSITPDGETVLYVAAQDTAGNEELYAVGIEGGTPRKLNHALPPTDDVVDYKLTSDGTRVLYRARNVASGPVRLWSVPLAGGTPVDVSGTIVTGDVGEYQITPDDGRVVFLAQGHTAETTELYSRAVDGSGSRVRLNDPITAPDQVLDRLVISPDSSRVVFRIFDDSAELFQLYSASVASPGDVVVNGALIAGGNVDGDDFVVTPNSQHVVYLADQDTNDVFELYRAPITGGGTSIKLSGTVSAAPGVTEKSTYMSPDGQYVVFRISASGILQLYSARVDGTGSRVRLNPTLIPGGQVDGSIFITPNSQRVVYLADQDTDDLFELYSVPIGGGTSVKISGPSQLNVVDHDDSTGDTILITPDSSRAVFKATTLGGDAGLYSAPVAGGSAVLLSDPLIAGHIFDNFKVTPDSGLAIYIAAQRPAADGGDLLFEIWRVPTAGGSVERLNGELAGGNGDVQKFVVSPTSGHVVYSADETTDNVTEVYQVALGVTCGGKLATIIIETAGTTTNGTSGPDVIVGTNGADTINGLGGRDTICGNGGPDIINGGSAGDTIFGGSGRDTINGGTGPDVIEGGSAGDTINGNGGRDTISGGSGADTIDGGGKADTIFGNGGRDVIRGGKAGDTISGGPKADTIDGNSGRDTIDGNKGPDTLRGGSGRDTINGGPGRDRCDGGSGVDTLVSC